MKQGNGKEMNADQNKWKKFPIMEINGLNKQRFQTFIKQIIMNEGKQIISVASKMVEI